MRLDIDELKEHASQFSNAFCNQWQGFYIQVTRAQGSLLINALTLDGWRPRTWDLGLHWA